MKEPHHNKREKLSSLLFDLVKYLLTVVGVGAILPESKFSFETVMTGLITAAVLLTAAWVITPEKRE